MEIKLGDTLIDVITGFKGVATGSCEYLYGCKHYLVEPKVQKEGTRIEPLWIEELRLKKVSSKKRLSPKELIQRMPSGGPARVEPPK